MAGDSMPSEAANNEEKSLNEKATSNVEEQSVKAEEDDSTSKISLREEEGEKKDALTNVSAAKTEDSIFNEDVDVKYSSDESDQEDANSISDSSSQCTSSTESESQESDSDSSSKDGNEDDEESGDENEGPIRSKNEVLDESAPSLPLDFSIGADVPIKYLGNVTGIVERNVLIQSSTSAEYQVLKEGAILCLEDRSPLGQLFEIFGRLQAPVYRLKYNSDEELESRRIEKGARVYYVVPSAQFQLTANIKSVKGSDASNWNDEEIPEEEQEFSDDEKEREAKRQKKRKKKENSKGVSERNKRRPSSTPSEAVSSKKLIPEYLKSRLTSLPASGSGRAFRQESTKRNPPSENSIESVKLPRELPPQASQSAQGYAPQQSDQSPQANILAQMSQMFGGILNPQNQTQSSVLSQPQSYQSFQHTNQHFEEQVRPTPNHNGALPAQQMQSLINSLQSNYDQQQAKILAQMASLIANQAQSSAQTFQAAIQSMTRPFVPQHQQTARFDDGSGPHAVARSGNTESMSNGSNGLEDAENKSEGSNDADGYDPEHPSC
ncbi:DEKNAAC104712 [Brettanomyces naardenensis]|uniref:H/ACA ribonucleoprotein complex non-core subunit NAF1 n=1 Tax=Brettanomyces naardenensis TaxID=13370 RepID=A0A448YRA4_BRENA|nr:DEKNAAC104712 [Brettanomyces naardenensis]